MRVNEFAIASVQNKIMPDKRYLKECGIQSNDHYQLHGFYARTRHPLLLES